MSSSSRRFLRSHTPSPSPSPRYLPGTDSLRSSSVSSLHGRIVTPQTVSQAAVTALPSYLHVPPVRRASPASSDVNVGRDEGGLLRDPGEDEGDVSESEETAREAFVAPGDDSDEKKKTLREKLRRTLSQRDTNQSLRPARRKETSVAMGESTLAAEDSYPPRQYFIITDSGKPVFVSRPVIVDEDIASITAITSALISVFADDTLSPSSPHADKLRCINAGSTRISFFLRPPLYFVCVSEWNEPESVARMHLEYLYLQILSVITASHLRRIFERRKNFDLGRLLEGAESFLHTMISRLQLSYALCATLSALTSLRLDASLRSRVGDVLTPDSRAKRLDILYVILVSGDRVVTLVRPKKHSVHPVDLHILFNALCNPSVKGAPASWLPICLPKYNSQAFVHAYTSDLEDKQSPPVFASSARINNRMHLLESALDTGTPSDASTTTPVSRDSPSRTADNFTAKPRSVDNDIASEDMGPKTPETQPENQAEMNADDSNSSTSGKGLTLVVVSGGGEFDAIRTWCESAVKKLESSGLISLLQTAVKVGPYTCSELGIPGLRHFLYKSRMHVQLTCPIWDDEYRAVDDQRRLITLYQVLHDSIHAKSGQESGLKLQYIRTNKESVMGWITQPFELYVALSPRLPKSAVVGATNAVARWVKREESRLFLKDAPIF